MRAIERYRIIDAVARFLVDLSPSEMQAILRTAEADYTASNIPFDWAEFSETDKIDYIRGYLSEERDEVLQSLGEFIPSDEHSGGAVVPSLDTSVEIAEPRMDDGPIFVVHGHARAVLHETVRVLERGTRREVIVLHEQPNAGRTILEKFEDYAAGAAFAVVLLTADDEGGVRTSRDLRLRGRQNVIFELGFFFGKLRRRRVAVLLEENVEKPSDVNGLVYITLDQGGAWKYALARELEAAGISVDRSRIP